MKKKALRKDFFVEIKNTFNRFISIFFIVALGVAFFVGIRSTEPDMRLTADHYYDDSNLMDIRLISTMGLTTDDLSAIKNTKGVKDAIGAYSSDLICITNDKQLVVKVMSYPDTINKIQIVEGRTPENASECIVDTNFLISSGYKIGDKIQLQSGTDNKLSDTLSIDSFTIVGSATTSYYMSFERGTSTIGNGTVDSFIMVLNDAFSLKTYTEIYLTVENALTMNSYSNEYDDLIENVVTEIKDNVMDYRVEARYQEINEEVTNELQDAKDELASKEKETNSELEKAKNKLQKAKEQLESSRKKIESNEIKLANAQEKITQSEEKIKDGNNQLLEGKLTLKEKKVELTSGKKELESAKSTLLTSKRQYEESKSQFDEASNLLLEKENELKSNEVALEEAKNKLSISQKNLEKEKMAYEEKLAKAKELVSQRQLEQSVVDQMIETATETFSKAEQEIATATETIHSNESLLIAAKAEITKGKAELKKNKNKLTIAKEKLDKAQEKITATEKQLSSGEAEINKYEKQLATTEQELKEATVQLENAKSELLKGQSELLEGKKKLKQGEKDYQTRLTKYEDAKAEVKEKLSDAKKEIEDAENEINDIDYPKWYVLDRNSIQTYVEYGQDSERIGAIGKVFPAIFFLVAALVSLTTMTRMVEEKRTEIGTLKALGYSKGSIAKKYIYYALLATIGGSIFGAILGSSLLPRVIIDAYKILYTNLPGVIAPINWYYFLLATIVAVVCVVAATLIACYKELLSTPAALMRPAAPKQGKKVFLEHFPFLWKRLNFTQKSTVRNLVRYKKRFFMTVFGIGGCMALLLVGFGLKNSISSIVSIQYDDLHLYDNILVLKDDLTKKDINLLNTSLQKESNVTDFAYIYNSSIDVSANKTEKTAYITVFKDTNQLNDFIRLRDRITKAPTLLNDDGVIITEKLAKLLNLSVGDTITLKDGETKRYDVTITGIAENYVRHYVYMSETLYQRLYQKEPTYNQILLTGTNRDEQLDENIATNLLKLSSVTNVTSIGSSSNQFEDTLNSLNIVIIVLIVSAGGLAFVVLYNLNNININERRRELATLKVLGFYDVEVSEYVFRENIILTLIGTALGVLLGILLHRYVILTAEIDIIMFGRNIEFISYVYSIVLTFLFSLIINIFMHFKLRKVDMVESLKSVE